MDQYRKGRYTRPEDKILEIGNITEHATPEELWECALEYKDRFDEMFGEHCKILDMALHVDEPGSAPHVHLRRVWIAYDDEGFEYVSQEKALEQLGYERPDMSQRPGPKNNAKQTFTKGDWGLFRTVCVEKGLDIDEEYEPKKGQKHLETLEFKLKTKEKLYKEISENAMDMAKDIRSNPQIAKKFEKELDGIDDKPIDEQINIYLHIILRLQNYYRSVERKSKNRGKFIEENGLSQKYNAWIEETKEK